MTWRAWVIGISSGNEKFAGETVHDKTEQSARKKLADKCISDGFDPNGGGSLEFAAEEVAPAPSLG